MTCTSHKHIWEICILKHLNGDKLRWTGEEEKNKNRDECADVVWSSLPLIQLRVYYSPKREEDSDIRCILCGPEHFYLNELHIIWLNPAVMAKSLEKWPKSEMWQLWSSSTHCQVENKATDPRHLLQLPNISPFHTHPVLAVDPRKIHSSEV